VLLVVKSICRGHPLCAPRTTLRVTRSRRVTFRSFRLTTFQPLQLPFSHLPRTFRKYGFRTSAKMSSPASRRSQRKSVSATPQRSARSSQQAPSPARSAQQNGSQATPRASRQNNIAASSPLIYHSSPLNGAQPAAGADEANEASRMNISSPPRQMSVADHTPRGRVQALGGMES